MLAIEQELRSNGVHLTTAFVVICNALLDIEPDYIGVPLKYYDWLGDERDDAETILICHFLVFVSQTLLSVFDAPKDRNRLK